MVTSQVVCSAKTQVPVGQVATEASPERQARRQLPKPDLVEDRLYVLAEMLLLGASRQELLDMAQRKWHISPRTAQDYLRRIQQRLAGEAASEDRLFYLRLSQLQRDRLLSLVLRYVEQPRETFDPHVLQSLSAMVIAVRGLLDSRDRCAAEINELVNQRIQQGVVLLQPQAEDEAEQDPQEPREYCASTPAVAKGEPQESTLANGNPKAKTSEEAKASPARSVEAPTVAARKGKQMPAPRTPPPGTPSDGGQRDDVCDHNSLPANEMGTESEPLVPLAAACAGCATA